MESGIKTGSKPAGVGGLSGVWVAKNTVASAAEEVVGEFGCLDGDFHNHDS